MTRIRLDRLLVERGVFPTRAAAQAAIAAGRVVVAGAPALKASAAVSPDAVVEAEPAHPYVSRGGVKLAHALDAFGVDPSGRVCLDLGASTGGFTQVLLERGAAFVTAVDVGHGQLHPTLQANPRVVSLEGLDARRLTRERVPESTSLIVADVSFISLAKALPAALALAAPRLDVVALIKPQFESGPGRRDGRGNLDEETARSVAEQAALSLQGPQAFQGYSGVHDGLSLRLVGLVESPIKGSGGAKEWLAHAVRP